MLMLCVLLLRSLDRKNYPYKDLAAVTDFLFVMSYDMEFWDDYTCMSTSQVGARTPTPSLRRTLSSHGPAHHPLPTSQGSPPYSTLIHPNPP